MLIVVTGLAAEARLVRRDGVRAIAGGGDAARLANDIEAAISDGGRAVLSFGLAGGLEPGLVAGTIVVADTVLAGHQRLGCTRALSDQMRAALPASVARALIGVDSPVMSPEQKAALHARTAAAAVDMESHIAARAAVRAGLPFVVARAIADPSHRAVPAAAVAGMRRDGTTDIPAVLRELARKPAQLLPLLNVAIDSMRAFTELKRAASIALPLLVHHGLSPGTGEVAEGRRGCV